MHCSVPFHFGRPPACIHSTLLLHVFGRSYGHCVCFHFIHGCADALGPPQQVRATVVNQTKINVTWSPPDGADGVEAYTVSLVVYVHVLLFFKRNSIACEIPSLKELVGMWVCFPLSP